MKKVISCFIAILLLGTISHGQAQTPYKQSVGGYMGNMIGGSYKAFLNEHLAFEGELGFRMGTPLVATQGPYYHWAIYFTTFEANPNLLYEGLIAGWDFATFHWFAGGGASLGVAFAPSYHYSDYYGHTKFRLDSSMGKFGLNAMGGVELVFRKIPLACQFDFRPGYGMLFDSGGADSYFDYGVGISARYILN